MMRKLTYYWKEGKISYIFILIFLTAFSVGMLNHPVEAQDNAVNLVTSVSISEGDEWVYSKGLQKPPRGWVSFDFDDSNWQRGYSGLGYGIGSNRTYLGDMQGNYLSVYARKNFSVDNLSAIHSMMLSIVCDGPFIAYLNGIEVIRTNTVQSAPLSITEAEQYDISGFVHELFLHENVLSTVCSNDDINSDNFSFIPVLEIIEKEGGLR